MSSRKIAGIVRGALAVLAIVLGGWFGCRSEVPARLHFLAVGQGDAILFTASGRAVLVDAGPVARNAGERIVVPKLRRFGADRLDWVLLTHPDSDHTGGTTAVLQAHPEARLAISAYFRGREEIQKLLEEARVGADRVDWLTDEGTLTLGAYQCRIVCPRPGVDDNSGSVIVRIAGKGATALLTGDAPASVEMDVTRDRDWSAQVVKAGHHGSSTSTSVTLLRRTHPNWVVVSCGRANAYGHPSRLVIDRVAAAGANLARTDVEGDINFVERNGRFERE